MYSLFDRTNTLTYSYLLNKVKTIYKPYSNQKRVERRVIERRKKSNCCIAFHEAWELIDVTDDKFV